MPEMNILYYLHQFPKLSESFILNEIYELEKKGHAVAVCALTQADAEIAHQEYNELDIPIYYIDSISYRDFLDLISPITLSPRVLKNTLYRDSPKQHVLRLIQAKRCAEFVEQLDWEIDHVHAHFADSRRYGARHLASHLGIPLTVTTHAYDLYEEPISNCTAPLLSGADRIITISEYNKRYIRNNFTSSTPIDVVRAGIRPEKFSPTKDRNENRILTVSRFVEKKGLPYAMEAVASVADTHPQIEYHLIGSGPLKEQLQQQAANLEIEEQVRFLGNVTDERLLAEIDEASYFLLPSIIADSGDRDGIPVSLMEAMAMRTVPISTAVSGIPELIEDQHNGLLVEPEQPEAIRDALLEVLDDAHDFEAYAANARMQVVDNFNIVNEVEKLEKVFQQADSS